MKNKKYKIILILNFLFTIIIGSSFTYFYKEVKGQLSNLKFNQGIISDLKLKSLKEMHKISFDIVVEHEKNIEELKNNLDDIKKILKYQEEQLSYIEKLRDNVGKIFLYEDNCEKLRASTNDIIKIITYQLEKNTCRIDLLKRTLENSL